MGRLSGAKSHWKLVLNILTILALVGLAFAIREQLVATFQNLQRVILWFLLLLIPVEALNYHAQAKLYQRLFAAVGVGVSYRSLLRITLELNFVNHVFPSAGVSGLSYFGLRLRSYGIRVTRSALVQTVKLIFLFVSFELVLLVGVVLLALNGQVNDLVVLMAGMLTMLILCGTAVFIYVIGSQTRIQAALTGGTKFLNRIVRLLLRKNRGMINIDRAREIFERFHQDYLLVRSDYRKLLAPFWWALVANVTEVVAIYVVYIAFGAWINLGAIILAYAVANFAGLVSVLPGGTGIYEALMTAVLVAVGVPARLSLPVTVMYRVLNTLLQVPPGYVLYQRTLRKAPAKAGLYE